MTPHKLLFVFDPLCPWCYGIMPTMLAFLERHPAAYDWTVLAGGLALDATEPVTAEAAQKRLEGWQRIGAHYDLPFDLTFFDKHPGIVLNSTLLDLAMTAAFTLSPEKIFPFLFALTSLTFAKGHSPVAVETMRLAAIEVGIEEAAFLALLESEENRQTMEAGFALGRTTGVYYVPTLYLWQPDGSFDMVFEARATVDEIEQSLDCLLSAPPFEPKED